MYVILMGKAGHRTPGGLEEPLQEKEGGHQIVELCCLFCCTDCLLCYFCLQRNWNYGSNLGLRKSHRSEFYDCGFRVLMSLPVICVLMPPTFFFSHKQMWEPDQMNMEIRDEGVKLTAVLRSWLAPSWPPLGVLHLGSPTRCPPSLARVLIDSGYLPYSAGLVWCECPLPPACQSHPHGISQLWATLCSPIWPTCVPPLLIPLATTAYIVKAQILILKDFF